MAGNDAMFTGMPNIIAAYDRMDNPVYSVWVGKDMLFSNNSEDKERAKSILVENLEAAMQNENRNLLKIKFHPKIEKTYITDKSPTVGTLYVRVAEWFNGLYGSTPGGEMIMNRNSNSNNGAVLVLEKLAAIESRIAAMEADEMEDDDSELSGLGKIEAINETISKICTNPLVMSLIDRIFKVQVQPEMSEASVLSGFPISKELGETLSILAAADPKIEMDLKRLAIMSQKNPHQFNFLLKTLRTM